jgi:hypothetical protein
MALIQKAFSDIITFSRSSNATRIGPTGLVEYAPHNLLLRSQEFDNASWTKINGSITANAIAAPDGTISADKYTPSAINSYQLCYQTAATYGTYTFSVYAKAGEYTQAMLWTDKPITFGISAFNLSNGTIVQQGDGHTNVSITSVGNGWYRCSITAATTSGTPTFYVGIAPSGNTGGTFAGDGTSGGYLWGAQLSVGPYALDYTPTTSAAVYGPRFDYDGSGVTIVEPVSTNLILYSEQFDNAYWTVNNATVTANSTTAPDGTNTADLLTENSSSGVHRVYKDITLTAVSHSASIYAKPNGRSWIYIRMDTASGLQAWFNISTGQVGTVQSGLTASIQSVGNGWYRCTVSGVAAVVNNFLVGLSNADNVSSYTGDGTSGAYLWGGQLEVGSTATAYMVSGATNGFRAVPVVSGSATPKGLLIEEQRQNLFTYSEQLNNVIWSTAGNVTLTANTAVAPDGTTTADTMTEVATNATHRIEYITSGTSVANQYTVSFYVKVASGAPWFRLSVTDSLGAHEVNAWFDLTNGVNGSTSVVGSAVIASRSITAVGNGWYRCVMTGTVTGGTGVVYSYNALANADLAISYLGSTSRAVYLWGAQLEAGSFATSYIPTLASSVTRSADVASVNTLSPWFNATEGTLFAEYSFYGADSAYNNTPAMLTDGTENNYIAIFGYSSAYGWVQASGATSAGLTVGGTTAINTTYKAAVAYKTDDFAFSLSGISPATDSSGSVPTVTSMLLGRRVSSSKPLHGHIRRVAYFPRRLQNAELQALTA